MKEILQKYFLRHIFKFVFAITLVILFLYILRPFVVSIALGGILAMALSPFIDKLIVRGLKRAHGLLVIILGLGILVLVPAVVFFIRGSRVITQLVEEADFNEMTLKAKTGAYHLIDKFSSVYGLDENFAKDKFNALAKSVGGFLSQTMTSFVGDLPEMFLLSFITMLTTYILLKESEFIRKLFDRYFYFTKKNGNRFIDVLELSCREVFFTNIVTGIVQATIVSVAAMILGVGDFFLIFFITFISSFIPIIGAGPVAGVLGIYNLIESQTTVGIILLVVAVVTGVADNVIRPLLAARGDVAVHPFIGLLAVIGGVIMFGLPGLFIGPLIASLCFGALPIIIEEYFPHTLLPEIEDEEI
jgi:predicted PurR-regulated permease PerM